VRGRAALALLVGACSPGETPPARDEVAATPTPTPSATLAAVGSSLRGEVSGLSGETSRLTTRVTDLGTVVELPTDTLFAFDKAELSPEAQGNLAKAAELIRAAPHGPIAITGHTDAKGEDAYNQRLSEQRAEAVAEWMRGQVGVRQRTFTVSGEGEGQPVAPNARPDGSDDPAERARNRRVELLLPR
jgi:outer membrane protein OmpA-like peptidoglycan-associated protein